MAGGGAPQPSGGEGKKSVDFQLNLVPMIDLLSVLISFLLMSAVWTQIARIEVKQSPNLPSDEPPPEQEEEKLGLNIIIKSTGYSVTKKGGQVIKEIETVGEGYDVKALGEVLKQVQVENPENAEVIVTSEDKVPYQELITVMDVCIDNGLEGIQVAGIDS
ncbi:MAG: biopolymer transporter ExbD [Myxococcota bacterium]